MTGQAPLSAPGEAVLDPEEDAVLDQRALALAAPLQAAEEQVTPILTFALAGSRFAVELGSVQEVVRNPALAVIPGGPDAFVGLLGLRGQPVAVADLRRLLGLPAKRAAPAAVVVIDGPPAPLGLACDALPRLESLPAGVILAPPPELPDAGGIVAGLAGEATLLAAPALLADARLVATSGRGPTGAPPPQPEPPTSGEPG
jgi:chemotaxis signal transduction protein